MPLLEWAGWWDKTVSRWYDEGLSRELRDASAIREYLGLDVHRQLWISPRSRSCPSPPGPGMPLVADRKEYLEIKRHLYPDPAFDAALVRSWAERQKSGEMVVWITLSGFFWFPRGLLGIEPHLCAFYDQPSLLAEINQDLLAFNLRVLDQFCEICIPDFMTVAEDMSYNHGPMLSKPHFDEFMAPYYHRIIPSLMGRGIILFVDTDGDVTVPACWFEDVGVAALLPLERMAGVDVATLRRQHPRLRMIGAFDKTVMHLGEERIRKEFERLLPVMRQGGFIPSVDHQTPPEVSLDDYLLYARLLREYCEKACR
ncbi:MAG TPA: uroporphyrinogen decarboxylase family protein [Armatimonadota bacterium]|nr:uroporphyrinogen decarboxylase family protein [Armatimonadota bacterium]